MENDAINSADSTDKTPTTKLQQEAANVWYECKDGMVTQNPRDCWKTNFLPPMDVRGLAKS